MTLRTQQLILIFTIPYLKNVLSTCDLDTDNFPETRIYCSASNEGISYPQSTVCTFTCSNNPKKYTAKCQKDQHWDLDLSAVKCSEFVKCKNPSILWPQWDWQCTFYYNQGSVCYGTCQSNVTVKSKISCLQNGVWQMANGSELEQTCDLPFVPCQNPSELWRFWNWKCSSVEFLPRSICNGTCAYNTDTFTQIQCLENGSWDYRQDVLESCQLACQPDWIRIGDTCFYFEMSLKTYYESAENCEELGARLYEPKNLIENNEVFEIVAENLDFRVSTEPYAWIGLHSPQNNSDTFVLLSSGLPADFYNWGPNEPNNRGGQEFCGEFRLYTNARNANWNDLKCSKLSRSICEKV